MSGNAAGVRGGGAGAQAEVAVLARVLRVLQGWPRWLVTAVSLGLVMVLGVLDYATGTEINLAALYIAPIAMATWALGTRWTAPVAVIASLVLFLADYVAGTRYGSVLVPIWNVGMRFGVFLLVSRIIAYLHQTAIRADFLARTDELTGIGNVRDFRESATREIARAVRYNQPFTIAYIDIDDFKRINDTFGHEAGDRALRVIGHTLATHVRKTDIVARLGGDEFVVLLPVMSVDQAERVLELVRTRLVQQLEQIPGALTCSIGAVTFETPPASVDEMLKLADDRMYAAKDSGKDTIRHVVISDLPGVTFPASAAVYV